MIVCRIVEPFMGTQLKMIFSGLGVACFLILLPALIRNSDIEKQQQDSLVIGVSFALGTAASILFRTLGSSVDISMYGLFQWIGWFLAGIAAIMFLNYLNSSDNGSNPSSSSTNKDGNPANTWKIIGISLGIVGILILVYFAFSSPTVISRWTEGNYILILSVITTMIALFGIIAIFKPNLITRLKQWMVILWNGLFVLMLVLTISVHQVTFPSEAGAYPIVASTTTFLQQIPLILMLILSPIVFIDFTLLIRELINRAPTLRTIGGGFSVASIFFLLMIFANIFTTTYDYIPGVGPFFRDMFWFVFLLVGLSVALPILFVKRGTLIFKEPFNGLKMRGAIVAIICILLGGTILGGVLTSPHPTSPVSVSSVKVLTYNVQQGYNEFGTWNFDGQLEVIKAANPDIIGLQETDIARISGGNADIIRYIADKLNLYSYYGPKTVVGTFGIALLSKYPIQNAMTFYVYSLGEQIACIQAEIVIGATIFNIFVAHPAGPNRTLQQQQMLSRISGKSNVIFMGDFNFEPNTEPYNLTVASLVDCWLNASSSVQGSLPISWVSRFPAQRIDHVFVTPGMNVTSCTYFGGSNSDHPAVLVEIQL
ncbi:MAG: endonuclease/exonuclease/phosphatase family protein [Candidatus Helarchaeota archaeon]